MNRQCPAQLPMEVMPSGRLTEVICDGKLNQGGPEEPPTFVIAPLPVNLGVFVY